MKLSILLATNAGFLPLYRNTATMNLSALFYTLSNLFGFVVFVAILWFIGIVVKRMSQNPGGYGQSYAENYRSIANNPYINTSRNPSPHDRHLQNSGGRGHSEYGKSVVSGRGYRDSLDIAHDNSSATDRILRDLKRTGTVDHDIFAEDNQIIALYKAGIIGKEEYLDLKIRLGE